MKFREWFSFKGIRAELGKVRWLTKKELAKDSLVVLGFCLCFGLYFFASDFVIAAILELLGI